LKNAFFSTTKKRYHCDQTVFFVKKKRFSSLKKSGWEGGEPALQKNVIRLHQLGVMSVAGPIPALASVSVLQSAPVGGSVVGVVGPL